MVASKSDIGLANTKPSRLDGQPFGDYHQCEPGGGSPLIFKRALIIIFILMGLAVTPFLAASMWKAFQNI
jgi:hypothetical protein